MVAVSVKLAVQLQWSFAMKRGHQLPVVFAELHMQSSQGDPVQQFSSQAFPSKHQLSSDLKLHPNTSWAQN